MIYVLPGVGEPMFEYVQNQTGYLIKYRKCLCRNDLAQTTFIVTVSRSFVWHDSYWWILLTESHWQAPHDGWLKQLSMSVGVSSCDVESVDWSDDPVCLPCTSVVDVIKPFLEEI